MSNSSLERYIKKESFMIVLDSRNAETYLNGTKHSNVMFDIKYPIQIPKDAIYATCVVNTFTCPVSFYQINSTNNNLRIFSNNYVASYYFPDGNYNANTFMTAFRNLLPAGFTITYDSVINKFSIGYTTEFSIYPCSILSVIGGVFDNSTTYTSNITNTVYLPFPCNFAGLNSFNIRCSSMRTNNLDSFDVCSTSDIIASIPVNAMPNGVIFYEKRNDFEFEFKESIISELQIELMDDQENYLDLNNQHWNLVLQINYVREVEKDIKTSFHDIVLNNYSYNNI